MPLSSVVYVLAQSERGLVLQEPSDVAPPPANTTVPNATSIENANATSSVSVTNRSIESTPGGQEVIVKPEPMQQMQNVTEPEQPVTENQTEPETSAVDAQNNTDSEQSPNNSSGNQ